VGYMFQNWNDVDSFFETYGRQFGFAVIKIRVEQDNDGIIKHRAFGCASCITVTTFVNIHNHELHLTTCKYSSKFRSIGKDAIKEIEFYTKNGNLLITIQRQLLKAKYPDITFLVRDLANAIQHFKTKSQDFEITDASRLFLFFNDK
ncbi:2222_t:CDS:2, partial [Cetraspora pellucida]